MNNLKFKKVAFCSLVALFATGQAFAHTGVRDKVEQGLSSYNGFTITHGCAGGESGSNAFPVIGQAALFPFGEHVAWRDSKGTILTHGGGAGVFDTIVMDHTGLVPLPDAGLNLSVTGYAGGSPFATTREIVDELGNVQALIWSDGAMEPKLNAITPFKVTIPKIIDNCVTEVKVRIGVINYCDVGKNASNDGAGPYEAPKDQFNRPVPLTTRIETGGIQLNVTPELRNFKTLLAGNGDNNRQDWWFTALDGGSNFYNDPDVLQPSYWSTMTVLNSKVNTDKCTGTKRTVSVEPTGWAFDTYLNGPNTRPFTKGNGNF